MSLGRSLRRLRDVAESVSGTRSVRPHIELYERTLRELDDVTPAGDDAVAELTDWLVERIETEGSFPPSTTVREHAVEYCRREGYDVPEDSWLRRERTR